jgi:hypothetical protein
VLLAYYLVTRDPQYDVFLLNSADEKNVQERGK